MKSYGDWKRRKSLLISFAYIVIGILWVTLGDAWVGHRLLSSKEYWLYQEIKGVIFVCLSGIAVYFCAKYVREQKSFTKSLSRLDLLQTNFEVSSLADQLNSSVSILRPENDRFSIVYVNHGFTRLTGYDAEEALGKELPFLKGKNTSPAALERYEEALRAEEIATIELLYYRRDGTPFWNELKINPVYDADHELLFFIVLQNDITKRKCAERRLQESEQRYKSLFAHNPDMVCSLDMNGVIKSANPAVEKFTGYGVDEVIDQSCWDFISDRDRNKAKVFFEKVYEGNPQHGEYQMYHKSGDLIDIEAVVIPIIIDGEVSGTFTIAKDVTEQKKTQELLGKAEKLNVVGELAAGIAHEIRNPLTSLKGFVQLLRPNLSEKKAYTDVMLSELDRIEQIVTELLLLAKPKPALFEEKNLKQLLEHVRTLLNTKAIMSNTEIVLHYQCDIDYILCEENQLKQVLINLLKNAIEAMPDGGEILIRADKIDHKHVQISIIDEGQGIPEEHLPKLGEPFYTTKEQGTGLGLMISWKIIKEHGGEMVFESEENKGTTVQITLPVNPKVSDEKSGNYQITS